MVHLYYIYHGRDTPFLSVTLDILPPPPPSSPCPLLPLPRSGVQEQEKSRLLAESMKKLDAEMKRTDALLYQMIPKPVADLLRRGEPSVATCQVRTYSVWVGEGGGGGDVGRGGVGVEEEGREVGVDVNNDARV